MPQIASRSIAAAMVLAVVVYAGITLLYVMPEDSPLRKDNNVFLSAVEPFFFQRWSFFAPPPQDVDRTYFVYSSSKDPKAGKFLEITRPVTRDKSMKDLHNEDARILDYILSGLRDQTVNLMKKMRPMTEGLKNPYDQITIDSQVDVQNIISLKNYARIVAKQNSLPPSLDVCSIELISFPIPDFQHRSLITLPYSAPAHMVCLISPFYVYKSDRYIEGVQTVSK
jgi:hypothetical protein